MSFEKLLQSKFLKRIILSLILGVIITSVITNYSRRVMADITNNVVRLHILANSNNQQDQQLKIQVRDDVIEYLKPILNQAKSITETEELIKENLSEIEKLAEKSIKKHGYTYSATAVFGNFNFPMKNYENATFPAGKYDALRIIIGEGKGNNWWCVLYPQLCFSSSENGQLPPSEEAKLKNVLTEDEFQMITSNEKINFKLKIVELFS